MNEERLTPPLGNALKFRGEEPPRVHITVERGQKERMFLVSDYGIGIEPQHAERVFSMFQRLHTRDEYPGTGIGLAIYQKIVESDGGRIWVESELGEDATVYFTIPMAGLN